MNEVKRKNFSGEFKDKMAPEEPASPHRSAHLHLKSSADLLQLHGANPDRYPFLLESVAHGAATGRFDILFGYPEETLELSRTDRDGERLTGRGLPLVKDDFLASFDAWWSRLALSEATLAQVPFTGGWFVYLGYELGMQIEPKLGFSNAGEQTKPGSEDQPRDSLPVAFATRIPAAFIRDHQTGDLILVAEQGRAELLETMHADLERVGASTFPDPSESLLAAALQEESPARFLQGVADIQHYIEEGDVFQVNLSRLWHGILKPEASAALIYQRLRQQNPAPFAALVHYRNCAILSSSPERLVSVRQSVIETRPIAGTYPRHHPTDRADTLALHAHPKERAEHIMLIDLERNDLGRVCKPGSVMVDELMVIESYAHVHHLVSNVRGQLRDAITPGEVLRAVFPGGTITGCPKVRCMEIIAELERSPRGAYTGSLGYINRNGDMDFNILIRTLVKDKQQIILRAGAGIVADSQPTRELAETRAKARGMILALEKGADSCLTRDSDQT